MNISPIINTTDPARLAGLIKAIDKKADELQKYCGELRLQEGVYFQRLWAQKSTGDGTYSIDSSGKVQFIKDQCVALGKEQSGKGYSSLRSYLNCGEFLQHEKIDPSGKGLGATIQARNSKEHDEESVYRKVLSSYKRGVGQEKLAALRGKGVRRIRKQIDGLDSAIATVQYWLGKTHGVGVTLKVSFDDWEIVKTK